MEAILMAGHHTLVLQKDTKQKSNDELQELLKSFHPMEQFDFTV